MIAIEYEMQGSLGRVHYLSTGGSGQKFIFEEKEREAQKNTIFWVREPILTPKSEILLNKQDYQV